MTESGTSPNYAFPWPGNASAPDGPTQIKALAEAVDAAKFLSGSLKPTVGQVKSTGGIILGPSYADITGASFEITPAVASSLLVVATFDFSVHAAESATTCAAIGTVNLDGTDITAPLAALRELAPATNVVMQATVGQTYLLSLTAAKHTIKLRSKEEGEGGAHCNAGNFLYALFAS